MDIGANNYPCQSFLCFLTLKLHPSFLLTKINHKSCNLNHNISHNRKIYLIRTLLTKFRSKKRFYTKHWSNEVGMVMLATQVNHILSHSLKSHREPSDQRSSFFFNFSFQSICPHQFFFISVSHYFNIQKFVIKKKSDKNACLIIKFFVCCNSILY